MNEMTTPTDDLAQALRMCVDAMLARGVHTDPASDDRIALESAIAALAAHERAQPPRKPDECANSCPPFQVCDYCHGPKGEDERAQPASVADGWVLVPRVPTMAMRNIKPSMVHPDIMVAIWEAMLAVAPQPAKYSDNVK